MYAATSGSRSGTPGPEGHPPRLPVERPLAPVEELGEHALVRAREDVARRRRLVLDPRAQRRVQGGAGLEQVLELVERDDAPRPRALERLARQLEQLPQELLRRPVAAADRHLDLRRAE